MLSGGTLQQCHCAPASYLDHVSDNMSDDPTAIHCILPDRIEPVLTREPAIVTTADESEDRSPNTAESP